MAVAVNVPVSVDLPPPLVTTSHSPVPAMVIVVAAVGGRIVSGGEKVTVMFKKTHAPAYSTTPLPSASTSS